MSGWKSIEYIVDDPIWVLKYDIYFAPDGNFCEPETPGAKKFTDCHGWYENERDAMRVLQHFPKPNSYRIEKVLRRVLIEAPGTTAESPIKDAVRRARGGDAPIGFRGNA